MFLVEDKGTKVFLDFGMPMGRVVSSLSNLAVRAETEWAVTCCLERATINFPNV